jgi:hypothetical protein
VQKIRGVSGPIVFHGRIALLSGLTTGMGANAPIFSARWATAAYLRAAIMRLRCSMLTTTAFTTPQETSVSAYLASVFTASDSGGTTGIPVAGQNSLLQVSESTQVTAFTSIQIAAAAALTPGTRTLDTIPFIAGEGFSAAVGQNAGGAVLFDWNVDSDQRTPLVLQGITPTIGQQAIAGSQPPATPANIPNNAQGIVIASNIAQGALGVVRFLVEMEWLEYATNAAEVIN